VIEADETANSELIRDSLKDDLLPMTAQHHQRLISVIVPVGARRSEIKELYSQYKAGLVALGLPYEIIFVLDGPREDASRGLDELLQMGEELTVVSLTRCFGEAAALMAGFERASGDTILTLPAYYQIESADIRKLVAALATADVAIGYRWPRYGNAIDRMRRGAFHRLVNFVTGSRLRDLGCGARALRRQVIEEIDLYGDQHRFIAILATRLGFRVTEVPVRQSARDRLARIYRPREYAHQVLDLFSIFFLVRFTKRPLRFFGMLGAATFSTGSLLIAWLCAQRLFFDEKLADRPALLLGALLLVLGMQIFVLGLLGELIIFTHARGLKDYRVEEVIQYPDTLALPDSASERNSLGKPDMAESSRPAVTA
jgi:glycosyltransferase involved in cell wall biosynthesis